MCTAVLISFLVFSAQRESVPAAPHGADWLDKEKERDSGGWRETLAQRGVGKIVSEEFYVWFFYGVSFDSTKVTGCELVNEDRYSAPSGNPVQSVLTKFRREHPGVLHVESSRHGTLQCQVTSQFHPKPHDAVSLDVP